MKKGALVAIVGLFLGALLLAAVNQQQSGILSVSQIVIRSSEYHGKQVEVRGFLLREFENSALYSSHEWQRTKGIWVTPTAEMVKQRDKLNRHYVLLSGVFDANDHGHLGQFEGTLIVNAFELLPDEAPAPPGKQAPK